MGRWASAREDVVRTGVAAMWFVGVALLWVLVLDELGLIPGYALAGALLYFGPRPTLRPEVGWRRARTPEGHAIVGPSQGQWRLRMAGGQAPAWVVGPDGPIPLDAAARALISGWSGQIENGMITVLEPPGTTDADRDAQRARAEGVDRAVAQAAGRPLVILLDDPDPAIVLGLWGALDPSVAAASRGRIAAAAAEIVRGGGGGIDGPAQVVAALTWLGEHGHPGDVAPADVGRLIGHVDLDLVAAAVSWLAGHGTVDEIPALSEAGSRASRQAIAAIQARIGGELALVAAPGDLSLTEPARARPTERASP